MTLCWLRIPIVVVITTLVAPSRATGSKAQASRPEGGESRAVSRLLETARVAMGVQVEMKVWTQRNAEATAAVEAAFAEIDRIDALMSDLESGSDVSRINRAAGSDEPVPISADTFRVLELGKSISTLTRGSYALTWASLSSLWSFDQVERPRLPDPGKALRRSSLVNDNDLHLDSDKTTARLGRAGMALGLTSIARGFALDRALSILEDKGFDDVLIFAGGDIVTSGAKGEMPWLVGIQDPRAAGYFATLTLADEAVVTSGDYEKFFEIGSQRYHHILDPRTGFPARGSRSVSVITGDALDGDAYATAVFILGPVDGMQLVESIEDVEALIVDEQNNVSVSSGLKNRIRMLRKPSP